MSLSACFPVSAILQTRQVQQGAWKVPHWELIGFVAGNPAGATRPESTLIRSEAGVQQWLWRGLQVCLCRDSAESYWYNLVGRRPSLFLICRSGPDGQLLPCSVSADYDVASAHMEADDTVFAAAMPPEVHVWLEHYVMKYYRPRVHEKRKRTSWTEEGRDVLTESPRLARP